MRLLRQADFARYSLATFLSLIGTWASAVALALRMYDDTHSAIWVGAITVADLGPMAILGLFFASRIRRLRPYTTMILADLTRGFVFLAMIFVRVPIGVVGLAVIAGIAGGLFRPMVLGRLADIVDEADRDQATGFQGAAETGGFLGGYAVAGSLLPIVGSSPMFALNALSFFASAGLLAGIKRLRVIPAKRDLDVSRSLRKAIGYVRESRLLQSVFFGWVIAGIGIGLMNATEVVLARHQLGASQRETSFLFAFAAFGGIIGALYATRASRDHPGVVYVASLIALGLACFALARQHGVRYAFLLFAMIGFLNEIAFTRNFQIFNRLPEERRTHVYSFFLAIMTLVLTGGAVLGSLVAARVSVAAAFVLAGCFCLLGALGASFFHARPESPPASVGDANEEIPVIVDTAVMG